MRRGEDIDLLERERRWVAVPSRRANEAVGAAAALIIRLRRSIRTESGCPLWGGRAVTRPPLSFRTKAGQRETSVSFMLLRTTR